MSYFRNVEQWSLLAAIRFVLASIVAINHLPEFVAIGALDIVPRFGAFEAILGFLLISGYSIGASYQKEPDGFLMRRVMRVYPIYLVSLALACLVHPMDHGSLPSASVLLVNILFLNQLITASSFVGPARSLSLEFWLYCLTPLLFKLKDVTLNRLVWLSFVSYLIYTCGRTLFHWVYFSGVAYGLNLLLLSYAWLVGLRMARNASDTKPVLRQIGVIFLGHIALAISIQFASAWTNNRVSFFFQHDLIGFALQACTLALLFCIFWQIKHPQISHSEQVRPVAWLRTLGDISYPLYLVHISVYALLQRTALQSPGLYYLMAVAVSYLIYKVVDRYSQRRHQRFAIQPQ